MRNHFISHTMAVLMSSYLHNELPLKTPILVLIKSKYMWDVWEYEFLKVHPIQSKVNFNRKGKPKGPLVALRQIAFIRGEEAGH